MTETIQSFSERSRIFIRFKRHARIKLRERREERKRTMVIPEPRYDEVYFEGVAWLDEIARTGSDLEGY